MDNRPQALTDQEWEAVVAVPDVYEAFGLEGGEGPVAWMKEYAYGVRFDFQTDGPGYEGPLYLIKGAGTTEDPPISLVRGEEGLRVSEW